MQAPIESDAGMRHAPQPSSSHALHDGAPSKPDQPQLWHAIEQACQRACDAIAPAWPLDRAIAVNPHWSRIGMPLRTVAARLALLGDMQVLPARAQQRLAWQSGRISATDLMLALARTPAAVAIGLAPQACIDALELRPQLSSLPLLIDMLDNDPQRAARLSWRQAITHQVSQTCAAYFDQHQADWQPERGEGLYAFWRDTLQHDHGIGMLMGLPQLSQALQALPATRIAAEHWALQRLGLPPEVWSDYLEAVLLSVNGWASWCAYLGWQARLEGGTDSHLRELLAIRLAWGAVLLECKDKGAADAAFAALHSAWHAAPARLLQAEAALLIDEVWQSALETGYQRELAQQLQAPHAPVGTPAVVTVQAAFCIDVRSEPLRRALEAVDPTIQTLGFAGFFGLPVAYTPMATTARRPQLPGLLAPSIEMSDRIATSGTADGALDGNAEQAAQRARQQNLALDAQWQSSARWPATAFAFVEAAGIGTLGKLTQWLRPGRQLRARDDLHGLPGRYRAISRPQIIGQPIAARVALAQGTLQAMGLKNNLAPLVVLMGHGSQSANNAQAAALDCGACCGQTGEVNARGLAQLLNDAEVRTGLLTLGTAIPATSWFVAALHNTTTDEIEGFDLDLLPAAALAQWQNLCARLVQAGDQVRRERAVKLGMRTTDTPAALLQKLQRRANDGAQTRPEWGLAGNAAFVIAPRQRTRGVDLGGRAFLHDYDATQDADGSLLEALMTAPMLVTHWINWQYHASTCAPAQFGSGNKLLHNVVGGNIGVFEGNGGDLRIGLSRQSLHDGERWVHDPLRLCVIIDAPAQSIESVLQKHAMVRQLVDNQWLSLWRFEGTALMRYADGVWQPVEADA